MSQSSEDNISANYQIKAEEQYLKIRLDKFLATRLLEFLPNISRIFVRNLIEGGHIINQDQKVIDRSSYKIKAEDIFDITIPEPVKSTIAAQNIPLDVLFEDDHMLVINKQAGIISHPAPGIYCDTLVNALLYHCRDNLSGINGVMRPGIVHRLDKDTSGLMVVAKNDLAHHNLSDQIKSRTLKRQYLAICYGNIMPTAGIINKNIKRHKIKRTKMTVVDSGNGRTAITHYKTIKNYSTIASLVECKLETGRTHQIRVHLSSLGNGIIGDPDYGKKRNFVNIDPKITNLIKNFPRQALHSYKISFLHPKTGEEKSFEIDLPDEIKELISNLESI